MRNAIGLTDFFYSPLFLITGGSPCYRHTVTDKHFLHTVVGVICQYIPRVFYADAGMEDIYVPVKTEVLKKPIEFFNTSVGRIYTDIPYEPLSLIFWRRNTALLQS